MEQDFGKPDATIVRVTMPRQHPYRQRLRQYLQARKPSQCNGDYVEKWVLDFPSGRMVGKWLKDNKKMGRFSLFACPEEGFVGGASVMNLRTNGFVSAEELLFVLQADWVEWIGARGQAHEYRFSTPASLEVLGAHLYDLNRVRTVGKRKKGKLMNTFWFLETDAGLGMYVKAEEKPPYARPYVQRTRVEETEVTLINSTTEGRWFSIYFGKATRFELVRWVPEVAEPVERQGVVWDESGATVWICVKDEKVVKELRRYPVIAFEGRGPAVVRQRREGPTSMEPMRSRPRGPAGGLFNDGKEKKEEGMKFSEVTRKMVEQLRKKAGLKEKETEEGPSRNQPEEVPDAQKVGEGLPSRAARPQGKGRRDGRESKSKQKKREVNRRRQQGRGPPYGPRTVRESSRGRRDSTRESHVEQGEGEERKEKEHGQEQAGGGTEEPVTNEQRLARAKGPRPRRRRRRSDREKSTLQSGNGTSSAATPRSVGEGTEDGQCSPDRTEGEGRGPRNPPITMSNRYGPLDDDSFEQEIQYYRSNEIDGPYDPLDRLEDNEDEDDGGSEGSDEEALTPEQLQAKERFLKEAAERRLRRNAVEEEEAKNEEQAALRVPTQSNDRENDKRRDEQKTIQDRTSHGPSNEQKDRKNDGQREGQSDGTTEEMNENHTETQNIENIQNIEDNGLTDKTTDGLSEKQEDGLSGCHSEGQTNEQTVAQQQALVTPVKPGTRRGRGSDEGDTDASRAGSEDGQTLKDTEQKGGDQREVKMEEGDHQREGDTKAQLDEEESAIAGDGASQSEDTEARTGLKGLEGPDGAPGSGSNISNMPGESPVAGRTRGKRFSNSALTDQLHNSYIEDREKVGKATEVLTGKDQPRRGRRTGRMDNLTHEARWGLRVRRK